MNEISIILSLECMFTHKLIGLKKKRINRRPPQNPIHVKALMATGFVPTVVEVTEEGGFSTRERRRSCLQ